MNILIMGGTGNISAPAAEELHQRGHSVTLLTSGRKPVPDKFDHIQTDRTDEKSLAAALQGYHWDAVIDFITFTRQECETAHRVLRDSVGQFIFISSATVYKKPPDRLPITEDDPLGNPFWEYARDKEACERYLMEVNAPNFPVTIVRPSHTFGRTWIPSPLNGSDFTVAARILEGKPIIVHGDGQTLWALTAAEDFGRGLAGLVGNDDAIGEAFHITTDQALTWNAIYYEIGLALGRQPNVVHIPIDFLADEYSEARNRLLGDKGNHAVFDNTKIKRFVPSFECRKSFRTAIRESIAWYNEDESRKVVNPKQDWLIDELIESWEQCR